MPGTYAEPVQRTRLRARPGLVLAAAAVLPALAAVLGGVLQVTRCVAVPDGVATVGLHLALLRAAPECPTTGVALGGESEHVVAIAVMLTVPLLLVHAVAVTGGWGALAALRRSLARLTQLTPWRRVPAPAAVVEPARPCAVVTSFDAPTTASSRRAPLLRGPPAALPA